MTSTLVRRQRPHPSTPSTADPHARARDWAEIQERMLVPLYEAVYERLDVGAGTRLLGLGCGSGLALLMAAGRGASVCGIDTDEARLTLARERLGDPVGPADPVRLGLGGPESAPVSGYTVVTAFEPLPAPATGSPGGPAGAVSTLTAGAAGAPRGGARGVGGGGPPR
ncbi:methyltransferase domain-containing protein, partial [Streptomyces sp. NPDC019937]|uniref:methyltransferase domain-containing protein n=1 Tax=Streptomyces sp. NPDC019937 TaxID=3154787 RepID=UPI0033F25E37